MMKFRNFGFSIVLASLLILSACGTGGQQNVSGNDQQEPENSSTETQVVTEENGSNPTNQAGDVKDEDEENSDAFRNIEVSGDNGEYVVTGEARVFEGVFYYTVEDGHNNLVEETNITVDKGAPAWEPFELKLSLPEDQLPLNGTLTLNLYERSAKDNTVINKYFVKLDEFGY